MRKFEAQKQIKSRVYSRGVLIALLIVIIFTAKGVFNIYLRNKESATARDETAMKLKDLNDRKDLLNTEISKLNQDDGVDQEIREKFNVIKPGENVVIIVPEEVATTTEEKPSALSKFWHWLW
ncbi:MAG: protein of unknown function with transrane region [Candidatus Taylorbacteria bacterium]|nr:protein of unknown function with transrane region [Candidatus Taylorbacteria bacterium]